MTRIISKYRFTDQGLFSLKIPINEFANWIPSNDVSIDSTGTITWWLDKPDGVLIQYPDGIRRFISKRWIVEEGVV